MAPDAQPPRPHRVFHAGELLMQQRAGVLEMADAASDYIRPTMPEQHRAFYSHLLNTLYVGGQDEQGRVWASVLAGQPGFISSGGPTHLAFAPGSQLPSDPVHLVPGAVVGCLGIDLSTRRRNRVNGRVERLGADGAVHLRCEQSVGNCPKYIQTRDVRLDPARLAAMHRGDTAGSGSEAVRSGPLGAEQLALIRRSDTFFVATVGVRPTAPDGGGGGADPRAGCDVSHRGGPPGFVEVSADGRSLRWPDYAGNNFFMTLGNLQSNPAAGLLFVDWLTGDVLQLTGAAEVAHDERDLPGAQRAVRFAAGAWRWAPAALPIRPAPLLEASPFNPAPAVVAAAAAGAVVVECVGVAEEAAGIKTFSFRATRELCYEPGQFASFDLTLPPPYSGVQGRAEKLVRNWTVSSHPAEAAATGAFTISVKRAGRASGWLHDAVRPGSTLRLRGISGEFTPRRRAGAAPALLLAGGIGITPMRVMFLEFVRRGTPAALLYSVRRPEEAAFLLELRQLAAEASAVAAARGAAGGGAAYRVLATATAGGGDAAAGWRAGRVDGALLREAAAGWELAAADAYLCGPAAFMLAGESLLVAAGVSPGRVHTESFDF